MPLAEREYLNIYFRADNDFRIYKREGYDLLGYLGDLGGFLDVLLVFGHLMTYLIAGKLFKAALMGRAYRLQSYSRDFSPYYKTSKPMQLTPDHSDSEDEKKDSENKNK